MIHPIRCTTQIWVVTRHQYGISTVVAQTSFRGETSGGDSKCDCFLRLSFSQIAANVSRIFKKVGTRQAVNERLGRLLSHVAFPCSNLLAEIPSSFLEVAC